MKGDMNMLCSKCGFENNEASEFCGKCGVPLSSAKSAPSKKSSKALILGIILGGVVLIAAAIILLLLGGGAADITGNWYNDTLGQTLIFDKDGTVLITTAYGEKDAVYQYGGGKGSITVSGQEIPFTASDEKIVFISGGDATVFIRAKEGMDIAGVIPTLTPAPSSTVAPSVSPSASVSETPSASAKPTKSPSASAAPSISYTAAVSFEIYGANIADLFDTVTAKSALLGKWYCGTGLGSTLEFYDNDTCDLSVVGTTTTFKFAYNPASGNGKLIDETDPSNTIDFHFDGAKVVVSGAYEYTPA
jgi:hypothetical protein